MGSLLVTGGAGFIGANFVRVLARPTPGRPGGRARCPHLRGQSREPSGGGRAARDSSSCTATSVTARSVGELIRESADRDHRPLRRRVACGPVDRAPGGLPPDQRPRHPVAAAGGTNRVETERRHRGQDAIPPHLDRRGLRFARAGRCRRSRRPPPYAPNSPYAASKAASDHLVRAYHHTYGLPVTTSNCSNNYGPYQFPEKLIPLMIVNALEGKPLPVYGDGGNVRDWLYVTDHCRAIELVLLRRAGRRDVQRRRRQRVAEPGPGPPALPHAGRGVRGRPVAGGPIPRSPAAKRRSASELVTFVKDRPGHDRRYAVDSREDRARAGRSRRRRASRPASGRPSPGTWSTRRGGAG